MADAPATGRLHGNTITLDTLFPALDGRRVQVIIAPLDDAPREGAAPATAGTANWPAWVYQGPARDDFEEHEFP